jgi:hypothetical protein
MTEVAIAPPRPQDLSQLPQVPRVQVVAKVPTGEIRIETGADGAWLLFDCECTDALPYCKAQCCALLGTVVSPSELEKVDYAVDLDHNIGAFVLQRDADGFCAYLDRGCRACGIYDDRPQTCRDFHCTRGATQRGWKLNNAVHRQSMS